MVDNNRNTASYLITAEIDPLQTEGNFLADKLTAAGVSTTYQLYPGTTHEFFGTYAVVPRPMRPRSWPLPSSRPLL